MPEYLAPGVYIEETSFRTKTIEGVSTSTAGFVGPTRYGPTHGEPELVTSFAEFERIYGGMDALNFADDGETPNYLAHAVRSFFEEGGSRLYVSRTYQAEAGSTGHASAPVGTGAGESTESSADFTTIDGARAAAAAAAAAAQAALDTATIANTNTTNALTVATTAAEDAINNANVAAATAGTAATAATTQATQATAAAAAAAAADPHDPALTEDARVAAAGAAEAVRIASDTRIAASAAANLADALAEAEVAARQRAAIAADALANATAARDEANTQNANAAGAGDLPTAQAAAIAAQAAAAEAEAAAMIAISAANGAAGTGITLVARYPGRAGEVVVTFAVRESQNVLVTVDGTNTLRGVREFDTLRFKDGSLAVAVRSNSGSLEMLNNLGSPVDLAAASGPVQILTVIVTVRYPGGRPREDVWENLAFDARHRNSLQQLFGESVSLRRMPALTIPIIFRTDADTFTVAARLIAATKQPIPLTGGSDGDRPEAGLFIGQNADDPNRATGLVALENIPDISIVAAPGSSLGGQNGFATNAQQISNALIGHCQRMRYRIAVLDAPDEAAVSDIRGWRTQFDSTHAALYYPWVCTIDPLTGNELNLPPSGFVAGIYARNDIARGVHKAPANEVVRSAIRFERNLNKAHQDVLNPEGINCFRWFQGRGYRLWGARTISSDPEWKYVSLRRYFAYLERSIELGTQWVVFEPNGPELWANVKRTIEDFLFNEFKSGRLLGDSPETSYFVRCDRSTMTQNDIDNGRLICLIGVSPLRPAEFVIFRIGQWTADSNQ